MSSFRRWQALFGARVPHPVDTLLLLGDGGCGKTTFQRALRLHETETVDDVIRETRESIERQWNAAAVCEWLLELVDDDDHAKQRRGSCATASDSLH
jgi:GTPase SAR1 family protein